VQRQFLVRNPLEELLEELVAQLHPEMLAWLEHWLVLLRQESQKLVTVVSADASLLN
jgi:predicted ATPase